jgi:hypothetical protein
VNINQDIIIPNGVYSALPKTRKISSKQTLTAFNVYIAYLYCRNAELESC